MTVEKSDIRPALPDTNVKMSLDGVESNEGESFQTKTSWRLFKRLSRGSLSIYQKAGGLCPGYYLPLVLTEVFRSAVVLREESGNQDTKIPVLRLGGRKELCLGCLGPL